MTWWLWVCVVVTALAVFVYAIRTAFWLGYRVAIDVSRRKVERQAVQLVDSEEPIPELFQSGEERRRKQKLQEQYQKRGGRLPWNFHRPGITEAEKEALDYQLETGKLDAAIDQIVAEETGEKR